MKKIRGLFILATIIGTTVLSVTIAHGGAKISSPVVITPFVDGTGYSADGALGSVRAQGGNVAAMWCRIDAAQVVPGNGNMIICHATDSGNNQVECLLSENDQVHSLTAAVAAMNGDSHVYFEVSTGPIVDAGSGPINANGICNRLQIENGSMFAPKAQ